MTTFLHEDTLHGRPVTVGVNLPLSPAPRQELRRRLPEFEREHDVSHLLLRHDLVWGSARPATVAAAQILEWPAEAEGQTLVAWPLDNSVWLAAATTVSSLLMVLEGSEGAVRPDEAVRAIEEAGANVVIVPGGSTQEHLEVAGYPPNASEGATLTAAPRHSTRPAWLMHTRYGVPHRAQLFAVAATLALVATMLAVVPFEREGDAAPEPIIKPPPPTGRPLLATELEALASAAPRTEPLQLYGLAELKYDRGDRALTFGGRLAGGAEPSLRRLTVAMGATLEVEGESWSGRMGLDFADPPTQPLREVDGETRALLSLARSAAMAATPVTGEGGYRSLTRRVELVTEGLATTGSMRLLAELLRRMERQPSATLEAWTMTVLSDGRQRLEMTAAVRGKEEG